MSVTNNYAAIVRPPDYDLQNDYATSMLMSKLFVQINIHTPFGMWYPQITSSSCSVLPFPITVEYILKQKI